MYRNLLTLLLCVGTVLAAPQKESKITYVKRQIDPADTQLELKNTSRQSKIEKLPLTLPGPLIDKNQTKPKANPDKEVKIRKPEEATRSPPTYNYSDRIYSIKTKVKNNDNSTKNIVAPGESVIDTDITSSDILSAESVHTDTFANNENSTSKYETDVTETDELVTERYEEELTIATEVDEETTKAPTARFLPKLSHYGKSLSESFSQNLISTTGKRKFRSRCKCEKIWNCAKLQITVPRCPNEYFLCCG